MRMDIDKKPVITAAGIAGVAVFVMVVIAGIFLWQKNRTPGLSVQTGDAQITPATTDASNDVVSRVGRHMILPPETPKVVPVVTAEELKKTQPFFANAENGDVLLVYTNKVVLYSPKLDKIVEIAHFREATGSGN